MEQQVLADHLSGFLAAEQGAWQYCQVAKLRANGQAKLFEQWAQQIAQHCQQLVTVIQSTGGDPNYVSPTACVAQFKATKLRETCVVAAGLDPREIQADDLENMVLLMTKGLAAWQFLRQVGEQAGDPSLTKSLGMAQQVEEQKAQGLEQAKAALREMSMQLLLQGPAPSPERWQTVITSPAVPIEQHHPAPMTEGLLEGAMQPMWQDSLVVRAMRAGK